MAFIGCKTLKQVSVPGTITIIGHRAFFGCSRLEKVTLGEGVIEIGTQAFGACDSLSEIVIPHSVERLLIVDEDKKCNPVDCKDFYGCKSRSHEIFPRNPNLMIHCPRGSKTEDFCRAKGYPFKYSDDNE